MEDAEIESVRLMYDRFNARDIDGVLALMTEDVAWANGMEGGHVHGQAAVRDYWTHQWSLVSPRVEPKGFERTAQGDVVVEVRQSVYDLDGKPLEGQTHGLTSATIGHVFRFRNGKVARFDIQPFA